MDEKEFYEASSSDDDFLIVLCAVRDGRLAPLALNEVIESWRLGLISRTSRNYGFTDIHDGQVTLTKEQAEKIGAVLDAVRFGDLDAAVNALELIRC